MKTCTKCKRELPLDMFVKSDRYLDGLYPSCKACRKATKDAALSNHKLCCKCKTKPHVASNPYCLECGEEARVRSEAGLARPRKSKQLLCHRCGLPRQERGVWLCHACKKLCSKCHTNPKASNAIWCRACLRDANKKRRRERREKLGATWYRSLTPDQLMKVKARKKLSMAIRLGKVKRQPCGVCGRLETEGHHHKGYALKDALDVQWLCNEHHWAMGRWKKEKLTADGKRIDGKTVTETYADP